MTAEIAPAPRTAPARQIDLPDNAFADQMGRIRFDYFADKLMPRRTGEAVVSALQFQICIANSANQQSNQRKGFGTIGLWRIANFHNSRFQMDRDHGLIMPVTR